jgi:hypothetical protein
MADQASIIRSSVVVVFQLRIVMLWYMGMDTILLSRLWLARLANLEK